MLIREATAQDWPAIWAFMRPIVAAGETFSWDRDTSEQDARGYWLHERPARTVVAVDADGTVLGTAESGPNHGGPGAHIASAGFMVARADGYRAMVFNAVAASNSTSCTTR
ncbi:MAG TPA: hypothetical protein VGH27_11105 [Streptosporangiaceae bacterium]|jgi:L-amino acid N-acyltransferase YncA